MRTFFESVLNFIFPPSEEARLVAKISKEEILELFEIIETDGGYALSSYRNPVVRALIHEAKFHGNRRAWEHLNLLVQKFLEIQHSQADIIIPIPLSPARLRTRGYNQIEKVLGVAPLPQRIPVITSALTRTRHTQPQTDLARNERLKNMRGAFSVTDPSLIKDRHILLFDDVSTTGSTLKAAKDTLQTARPKSIICVALAH